MTDLDLEAVCGGSYSLRDGLRRSAPQPSNPVASADRPLATPIQPAVPADAAALNSLLADAAALRHLLVSLGEDLARQERAIRKLAAAPPGAAPPAAEDQTPGHSSLQPGTLYVTFFGNFALYRGASAMPLRSNRVVLELCRYLTARAGQRVPRDVLLDLLWPEVPLDTTLHRLHVAVSTLRGLFREACGDPLVELDAQCYSVPAQAVTTDCDFFERFYQQGRSCLRQGDAAGAAVAFRRALDLYQGDYLADDLYAEWTFARRAHFVERRLSTLTFLCEYAAAQADLSAVIDYAGQILEIDNLRERSYRYLMRTYYAMGQRGCALRQYTSCAEILQRELGVPPSLQTQLLHRAISQDLPLPDESPVFRT